MICVTVCIYIRKIINTLVFFFRFLQLNMSCLGTMIIAILVTMMTMMVYTERAEMAAVSSATIHVRTKEYCSYTTWVDSQSAL